ncbi:peroxisomal membrane protein 4 [Hyaloraphidium curvatum]|nr:peroxisomal membrane protein 4 [Hyaloraphidium curvatum]
MAELGTFTKKILLNPEWQEVLAIVKGARNGAVYGAKIRFPHALVMTFMFRDGPLRDKIRFILTATINHATNLLKFATIYKSILFVLRRLQGKEAFVDTFIAGAVGGYIVFHDENPINQQIVLYLFSRVMFGLGKLAYKKGLVTAPNNSFALFAAFCWGMVMFLFRHERDILQASLASSMQYIYLDSEKWTSPRTFLWHNK